MRTFRTSVAFAALLGGCSAEAPAVDGARPSEQPLAGETTTSASTGGDPLPPEPPTRQAIAEPVPDAGPPPPSSAAAEIPTKEDFEEEAESSIQTENAATELQKLQDEIGW